MALDADGDEVDAGGAGSAGAGDDPMGVPDSIAAQQHNDVWLFSQEPSGGGDALQGGIASVEEDCLLVGGGVVVWMADDLEFARALVDQVADGEMPTVTVAGAGLALGEGATPDDLPMTVLSHCGAHDVWFANAPGELVE